MYNFIKPKRVKVRKRIENATMHIKDVNGRIAFKNPRMCCQFLKSYVSMDIFKDLTPEDIIDETKKYQAYLGIEFESDTVKKIILNNSEYQTPIFLISLIEHKSDVDYNITMQLLRYMVCIWTEYAKEMENSGKATPYTKNFMYPPILPIVYYEGSAKWAAGMNLKDRIFMSNIFTDYIPDFTYKLVKNQDFTNEELLSREDEMSLFMLINKIQTAQDMSNFLTLDNKKLDEIIQKAPEQTLQILSDAVWGLCMKMNLPQDEAKQCVEKVRGRSMGYLFENMEKIDIQAERRKSAELKKEQEKMTAEIANMNNQLADIKDELINTKDKLATMQNELVEKDLLIEKLKLELAIKQ